MLENSWYNYGVIGFVFSVSFLNRWMINEFDCFLCSMAIICIFQVMNICEYSYGSHVEELLKNQIQDDVVGDSKCYLLCFNEEEHLLQLKCIIFLYISMFHSQIVKICYETAHFFYNFLFVLTYHHLLM